MRAPKTALVLLCLAAAGCARKPAIPPHPGVPSPLRVGIADNYPPLAFDDGRGLMGVEVDFARELTRELGVRLEIVPTPWAQLIPHLLGGRIDVIMSGMSITGERARQVRFAEPYLEVGQMAVIRKSDLGRLAAPGVFYRGPWKVGVIRDTTGAAFAVNLPQAQVVYFTSVDDAVSALRGGRIDYFIHDAPTIWHLTADPRRSDDQLLGLYQKLTREELAWAVRPGDTALLAALNAKVAEWTRNGFTRLVKARWIGTSVEVY